MAWWHEARFDVALPLNVSVWCSSGLYSAKAAEFGPTGTTVPEVLLRNSYFASTACVVGLELSGFLIELLSNDGGHQGIFRKISGVEYNFRVRPKKPVVRILVIVEESHAPHF